MRRFLFFLLALTIIPVCAWADEKQGVDPAMDGLKVVEAVGKVLIGEDLTRRQARIDALSNAKRSALESAGVISLQSSTLLYNGDVISDLVNSVTKGLLIKVETLEDKCDEHCYVKIRAYVKPIKSEGIPKLKFLKHMIQRPDKKDVVSAPVFQNNDEVQVRAVLNADAFISVFSADQYGNITKLFPNKYFDTEMVPERKDFVFPDESQRVRGVKIRVATPEKQSSARETVIIIATKEKAHFLEDTEMSDHTIYDLMRELADLDQSQWAQKTIGYEVRK